MEEKRENKNSIKAWIQNHMIAIWAICSILFAIIIHLLFHWETDIEILHAKWSAGDILTYVSTVALGLLAVWQNQRFKEENDVAQERLERLTAQANEISLINKIVEMESQHLSRLRQAFDEFTDACNPISLMKIFLSENKEVAEEMEIATNNVNAGTLIDNGSRVVYRELPPHLLSDEPFIASFNLLRDAAAEYLTQARENHPPEDQYIIKLHKAYEEFDTQKERVLQQETQKLNKVMFETIPVSEIKKMYYDNPS